MQFLQPGNSYHIFNHGNGFENIFRHEANYYYFLDKYRKYIGPVAETYAWCLMPNHFHVVVRIRKRAVLVDILSGKYFPKVQNFGKVFEEKEIDQEIERYISKQFANLFSSYTQSFNKVYDRMGSLFIKNFKRELISSRTQFLNTVVYVHRNPIHHGFCHRFDEWPYSSYSEFLLEKSDDLEVSRFLKMVGGLEVFLEIHRQSLSRIDHTNYPEIPLS